MRRAMLNVDAKKTAPKRSDTKSTPRVESAIVPPKTRGRQSARRA
jgi:hypothetical protein